MTLCVVVGAVGDAGGSCVTNVPAVVYVFIVVDSPFTHISATHLNNALLTARRTGRITHISNKETRKQRKRKQLDRITKVDSSST